MKKCGGMIITVFVMILMVSIEIECTNKVKDVQIITDTESGKVEGNKEANGIYSFKGIPYGASTEPPLRWKPPESPLAWAPNVLDCKNYRSICPQTPSERFPLSNMSETCLHLNIWTPDYEVSSLRPVYVFIHGGFFIEGAGSDILWSGEFAIEQSADAVVIVTMNYRLGPLGYLNSEELGFEGNYGFQDTIFALQWIQRNIANFGGDPNQVTISGQSAGAMMIGLHLIRNTSQVLFHDAVMESAPMGILFRYPSENIPYTSKFVNLMNCNTNTVSCLNTVSWTTIITAQASREFILTLPINTTEIMFWQPVIDGKLIPAQPIDALVSM